MSWSRIQLSELKQLVLTCYFNFEMYFQLISCINYELRAMCFIKKTTLQSQSAIQMKSPQASKNDENIITILLELSMTDSCIDYHTLTKYQFSFGHCYLKQEKACSSGHQFLLWMSLGRKALASTVTLKFVCIHF